VPRYHPFLTAGRKDRVFEVFVDLLLAGDEPLEHIADLFSIPGRDEPFKPVGSYDLLLRAAEELATPPVDGGHPAFFAEGDEDDPCRIECTEALLFSSGTDRSVLTLEHRSTPFAPFVVDKHPFS